VGTVYRQAGHHTRRGPRPADRRQRHPRSPSGLPRRERSARLGTFAGDARADCSCG
jgi:hypothetical protein